MKKNKERKLQQLIEILFDHTARIDEKDDAAMYLSEYLDIRAVNALTEIGSNEGEDDIVLNSCGESLAQIWVKNNKFPIRLFDQLTETAKLGVIYVLQHRKPEWIDKHHFLCEGSCEESDGT